MARSMKLVPPIFFSADGSQVEAIYAGSGVYGVNEEILISPTNTQGIEIVYTAPDGKRFYSQIKQQPFQSSFRTEQVTLFKQQGPCIDAPCPDYTVDVYVLDFQFNCTLFALDGSQLSLENGEAKLPYFPYRQ